MIHVADRAHIAVGLEAGELLFGHGTPVVFELPCWFARLEAPRKLVRRPEPLPLRAAFDCQVRRSVRPKADPRRTRALALPSSALMLAVTAACWMPGSLLCKKSRLHRVLLRCLQEEVRADVLLPAQLGPPADFQTATLMRHQRRHRHR